MATSGTIGGYGENWGIRAVWSATTNSSTLKSTISYSIQVIAQADGTPFVKSIYIEAKATKNSDSSVVYADHNSGGYMATTIRPSEWVTVYSNSFTVSHSSTTGVAPDIKFSFSGKFYDTGLLVGARWGTISLNRINRNAYVSAAPNFNDEENPTMSYVVPSISGTTSLEACISFDGSKADIPYRAIDKNAKSYTFELTDEEREILRNATLSGSTSRTVYFYVRSTTGGYTSTSRLAKTLTIVNAEPDFSAFLLDVNDKTVALTGDSLTTLIKGYSNVAYEMGATPKKGASIVSYSAINGGNALTTASGTFEGVIDGTFKLSATDSRGITVTKEFNLRVIDYFRPTISQEPKIEIDGETTAKVTLVVSGEWCSKHYGLAHNQLRVEYRYKEKDGEFSNTWYGTDYLTDDNNYRATFTITDLDYQKAYTFESRVTDSLQSATTAEYTVRLVPVFEWSETDFSFNVPVNFNAGFTNGGGSGGAIVDYPIEQGTEAMGTNGTWYWTKWASGKAECYGVRNYGNMAINKSWGDFFTSSEFSQDLPATLFAAAPDLMSIDAYGCDEGWCWVLKDTRPTTTNSGEFALMRVTSRTLSQVYLSFHAIGRWK